MRSILLAVLLLAPTIATAQDVDVPSGCLATGADAVACRWVWDAVATESSRSWEIPVFPRTLATISITLLESPDTGWVVTILREGANASVSEAEHSARPTTASRHREETTHVFEAEGAAHALHLLAGFSQTPAGEQPFTTARGRFEVAYVASRVPEGDVPARPAATADAPQLSDHAAEVAHDEWDLRAAWWDDARLGDGLMEVHVKIGSLARLGPEVFEPPAAGGLPSTGVRSLRWMAMWTIAQRAYYAEWVVYEGDPSIELALVCQLKFDDPASVQEFDPILGYPRCAADIANGTLHASFPVASIGSPPEGTRFEGLEARTAINYGYGQPPDIVDEATQPAFLFALGGPRIWDELNGCRFCPPTLQWYQAPLAAENVDTSLQVLGSLAALATFLVGLVLIWRRRRATSRLLARVDAVAEAHKDQREALLALGRLEEEFSGMFRRHRISEGQYQVLSQRIATVATRFALRTSLGLDDGVPGEDGPTSVRIRKI